MASSSGSHPENGAVAPVSSSPDAEQAETAEHLREESPDAEEESEKSSAMMRRLSGSLKFVRRVSRSASASLASGLTSALHAGRDASSEVLKMAEVTAWVREAFVGNEEKAGEDEQHMATSNGEETDSRSIARVRQALGERDGEILPDEFLSKCLSQHYGHAGKAAAVARGFISFRRSVGWPFRIPCKDVEVALRTGMHWLLPLQCESKRQAWHGGGGDEEGPAACLVYNAAKLDPNVCPISEYQKMGSFLMEQATDETATQKRGVALIVDNAAVEFLSMLRIMSVHDMQRGILMWKGAFPCRIRRIWVIDAPYGSGTFAQAILGLLAPRVRERIRFARRSSDEGLSPLVQDLGCLFQLPHSLGGDEEMDWNRVAAHWISQDEERKQTLTGASGVAEEQQQTLASFLSLDKLEGEAMAVHQTPDEKQKQTEGRAERMGEEKEDKRTESVVYADSAGEAKEPAIGAVM